MDYRQSFVLLGFVRTIPLWVRKRWVLKRKADPVIFITHSTLIWRTPRRGTTRKSIEC